MWEYRLVKRQGILEVKEVYFDENGEIYGIADAPVPYGEDVEEVYECLYLMSKALEKDVVEFKDFTKRR